MPTQNQELASKLDSTEKISVGLVTVSTKQKIKLALGRSGMHNQEHTLGVTNCQIAPHETPVN
jgi:hypothetical protein